MIKIYTSAGTLKSKPANWDTLAQTKPIKLIGEDVVLTVDGNAITLNDMYSATAVEELWAEKLANAIAGNMTSSAIGPAGESYKFIAGFNSYKKSNNPVGYIVLINGTPPTRGRDFLFLSSPCVGYDIITDATSNKLLIYDQCSSCIPCDTYSLLVDCTWCLFHSFNASLHSIFKFDPTNTKAGAAALGTYPSYQAMLAKWNERIWTDSYVFESGPKGVETTFLVGYKNPSCTMEAYRIEVTLTLDSGANVYSRLLQVLHNGELSNTADVQSLTFQRCNGSTCTTETGTGTENVNITDKYIWNNYKIGIQLGAPSNYLQNSYYVAAFAIAVSGDYRESLEPIGEGTYMSLTLTAKWYSQSSALLMTKSAAIQLMSLQKYEPNLPPEVVV